MKKRLDLEKVIKMNNSFPEDRKYSKDYSWIKEEEDVVTLGIIAPAAQQVEEFIFAMLPQEGAQLQKGAVYVNLEAVKWSGEITTPVNGEVVAVNMAVFNEPSLLNKAPYDNWLVKIKINDKKDLTELMEAKEALSYYQEKLSL